MKHFENLYMKQISIINFLEDVSKCIVTVKEMKLKFKLKIFIFENKEMN